MRIRHIAAASAALAVLVSLPLAGQSAQKTPYSPPRTADGKPDLQGVWGNNSMTPLERPKQFGMRQTLTDAEFTALKKRAQQLMDGGDAFFGDELFYAALEGKEQFKSADTQTGNYDQTWLSDRTWDNRTSLIIDPPDGQIPALTPQAIERNRAEAAARKMRGSADRAQDLSMGTRCITYWTPNLRAGYQSYFDITQGPNAVGLRSEMIHDARVFPIDNGPLPSGKITQYHGHSRAHWEGDTLVAETRNYVPGAFRLGNTEKLKTIEKFRRTADDTLEYTITLDDPDQWVKPWTLVVLLTKTDEKMFEYACHEGNYGIAAILSGARTSERGQ